MNKADFASLVKSGPVLLDGATGSNLMKAGMKPGECPELWCLEHPQVVEQLQRAYIEAGSRIIYAPTFTAGETYLEDRGIAHRLEELNRRLVALSKKAAGSLAFVAGDMTTVGKTDLDYEKLLKIYSRQASALQTSGVDLFVIETMMGLEETLAALEACSLVSDIPVLCTFSVTADGMLYFGGSVYDAVQQLADFGADAVGINCSCGPDQIWTVVRNLAQRLSVPIIAKPNAGMPIMDEYGNANYSMDPEEFAKHMCELADSGARLLGGCCGTDPDYIASLKKMLSSKS